MQSAKETLQKVVQGDSGNDSTTQSKPGLERDMEPKPTKVHLGTHGTQEGSSAPYCPCGKLKGKNAVGIRVNAVAAGPVWTPMLASSVDKKGQEGHRLGNSTPMARLGQPSEVATTYVFLASGESQFMSGQTLHPNGGIVVNG
ncbi:hypothetical protein MY10362_007934 [Beauveria mimosiformis]